MRHRFVLDRASVGSRIRTSALYVLCLAVWACRSAGNASTSATPSALARGDHVVVEPRAAEFFEGRVLSIGKSQLRVEPVGKHEGVSVSVSDVYSLKRAPFSPKQGQLAICRLDSGWIGCRVEAVRDDAVEVRALNGDSASLSRNQLLSATPTTELNLRRAFGRASSSAAFAEAAARAGRPTPPAGYRVTPRAHVVARRSGGWFSGVVSDVRDQTAHVAFAPDNVSEPIAVYDLVPEPPASSAPARGDFVLVRPASPAEAWPTLRVAGLEGRDFRVVGPDGQARVVGARDVLPLTPPEASGAR